PTPHWRRGLARGLRVVRAPACPAMSPSNAVPAHYQANLRSWVVPRSCRDLSPNFMNSDAITELPVLGEPSQRARDTPLRAAAYSASDVIDLLGSGRNHLWRFRLRPTRSRSPPAPTDLTRRRVRPRPTIGLCGVPTAHRCGSHGDAPPRAKAPQRPFRARR